MQSDEQVSVVIPVFNEAPVIEEVIGDLMTQVVDRLPGSEIVVVDDCSTDATPLLLQRMATVHLRLRVIRSEINRGHGPSVVRGLDAASRPWVFLLDSDAQFDVADFWKLWAVREDAELVLGRREKRQDPRHRLVLTKVVRAVLSLLATQPLEDPNVPFRLMRRRLWLDLREHVGPAPRAPSIMISLGAALRGYRAKSLPVVHFPRLHSPSTLRAGRLMRFSLAALGEVIGFRNRVLALSVPEHRKDQAEMRSAPLHEV
ncbi:MAG: glycosyltransferase family 2 protein [Actinomycetota bacterium]|nr:glycosyltransferase family 2 protein [Actinomycetota bacterium]